MSDPNPPASPDTPATVRRVVLAPRGGRVRVELGTAPAIGPHDVLIRTAYSVVSSGTERARLDLAQKGLVGKARSRPDLVRTTIDRARREGVADTVRAVRDRLDRPLPLGYSLSGSILAVGERVEGLRPGDRVAAGGADLAVHADAVAVPASLVVPLPPGLDLESAAFATLGAVAMHGFRLSLASLGESVAVVGLGLVGLLAGSVARASGCRVIGVDVRSEALDLALGLGFDHVAAASGDVGETVLAATARRGADAVLLCAASASNEPVVLAARVARDRARVVVVGDVPVEAPRDLFFDKELELVVSRSYGPGRYDPAYERHGQDYPIGYVRWTERRNMEAFLDLLATRKVDVAGMITHRFPVDQAAEAYEILAATPGSVVVLEYGSEDLPGPAARSIPKRSARPAVIGAVRVGVIGAGSFAARVLIPALEAQEDVDLAAVASVRGLGALPGTSAARASPEEVLGDPEIDAVVVATRHDSHARLARAALDAGKAVFVEKPLALSRDELGGVVAAAERSGRPIQVGFNRRFAPLAGRVRAALGAQGGPAVVVIRVNAGALSADHWARDLEVGGGRILGEMCHFIDLAAFLVRAVPILVSASSTSAGASPLAAEDVLSELRFDDGSVASVVYTALGSAALGKERVEAFAGGKAHVIDDWRRLIVAEGGRSRTERHRVDKGHQAEIAAFIRSVRGGPPEPAADFGSALRATEATLAVVESLASGLPIEPSTGPAGE
jgi:predicted dehydrogenase/threonine dehydrogenase-like Zn-dependent dehydrogenase